VWGNGFWLEIDVHFEGKSTVEGIKRIFTEGAYVLKLRNTL
jgi:hypothetical protein